MKLLPSLLALLSVSLAAQAVDTTEILNKPSFGAAPEVKTIFNGKDLTGWKGQPEFWSVKDGAITGQTTKETPVKENTFLIWDGEVGDFELTFKFKIVDADGKADGFPAIPGVQHIAARW